MRIDTILHPTDFSNGAARARAVALDLATRHQAELHLFHGQLLHLSDRTAPPLAALAETAMAEAEQLVEQDPTRHMPTVKCSQLPAVSAFDAVMERATELQPDLIVLGTHGRSGLERLLIGSTAEKIVHHWTGHVVTVRNTVKAAKQDPARPRRILVPVDLSTGSAQALDAARWLAHATDTRLDLLHVVEPIPPFYYGGSAEQGLTAARDQRQFLERSLRDWSGDIEGATWTVTDGSAPLEIARIAKYRQADLVVMGTRGLTGLPHMLIGSVTERVCRTCDTPVLVVRDNT
jgi:nucleotide-binding universal stress UspA family protein